MSLVAGFFEKHRVMKRQMNRLFNDKKYTLKKKRFVLHEVLGFTPKLTDMTVHEMEQVIEYLKKEEKENG